jgi:hypothetical protein
MLGIGMSKEVEVEGSRTRVGCGTLLQVKREVVARQELQSLEQIIGCRSTS